MGLLRPKSGDAKPPVHAASAPAPAGAQSLGDPEAQLAPTHSAPLEVGPPAAAGEPGAGGGSGGRRRRGATRELTAEERATLEHLQRLTRVMDTAVEIPVIKRRFGLDAIIGLIPYVGDVTGATVGTYIISRALKYNMPKRLVLRMLLNQAIDSCIGIIPLIGDIFDFGFKANVRNIKLLQEHLERPKQATRADTCFLVSFFLLVVVLPVVLVLVVIGAVVLGILAAFNKL